MEELKAWKWMMPGLAVAVLFMFFLWMMSVGNEYSSYCASGIAVAMLVCVIQALAYFGAFYREIAVSQAERRKRIATMDMLTARLEAARGVNPDVAKVLLAESHRVWALRQGNRDLRVPAHSVLFERPNVTEYFALYCLENSTETTFMPKNLLVEGRKNRFDPFGAVDEYRMWDEFTNLLAGQGKIVKYSPYEPYQFVTPWCPRLIAEDFGWEWEDVRSEE